MIFEAVLFDLDGTLLDTAPDFHTALNRLLAEEQCAPIHADRVQNMVSNGSANLVAQAFNIDASDHRFDGLRERLLKHYDDCLTDRTALYPGLFECLEWLDANQYPWGIVTNKPLHYAEKIISQLELNINCLICPDHVDQPKPDPRGILLACEQMLKAAHNTLFVGDHLRDIEAGKRAGAPTIAAAWGYLADGEDPRDWDADYLLYSPRELLPLLRKFSETA